MRLLVYSNAVAAKHKRCRTLLFILPVILKPGSSLFIQHFKRLAQAIFGVGCKILVSQKGREIPG